MRTQPFNFHFLRSELYIVCDDFNLDWTKSAVIAFDTMWNDGRTLREIARKFKRDEVEVLLLYLDRAYKGKIAPDMRRVFTA